MGFIPIVKIDLWEGRDAAAKEKLIKSVTKAVSESVGCPESAVHIIINDVKRENWGTGGEQASRLR